MKPDISEIVRAELLRVEAETFLGKVFGNAPKGHCAGVFRLPRKRTIWLPSRAPGLLTAEVLASSINTYIASGLRSATFARSNKRGGVADVVAIPGVVVDLDLYGPAHKEQRLPKTITEIEPVLGLLDAPPTLRVWSGHGLQLWWLFNDWWTLRDGSDRARAVRLSNDLQATLRGLMMRDHGWALDATATLDRIWRPPGTTNYKLDPTPVRLLSFDGPRYDPTDLAQRVAKAGIDLPPAAPSLRPRSHGVGGDKVPARMPPGEAQAGLEEGLIAITGGCPFLRHCRDDRQALPEPDWFIALWALAALGATDQMVQDWSTGYPGYDPGATTSKFEHAHDMRTAPSCHAIRDMTSGKFCTTCPTRGSVVSPLDLAPTLTLLRQTNDQQQPLADPILVALIEAVQDAADATSWSGRTGTRDRQCLDVVLMLVRLRNSNTVPLAQTFIATKLDCDTGRAAAGLRSLVDDRGFLTVKTEGGPGKPATYTLTVPTWALIPVTGMHVAHTSPDSERAEMRHMFGLTGTAEGLVIRHLLELGGQASSADVARALGKSAKWVTKIFKGLQDHAIVERGMDKRWRIEPDFDRADAAKRLDVVGKRQRRRERLDRKRPAASDPDPTGKSGHIFVVSEPTDAISRNPKAKATLARRRRIEKFRWYAIRMPEDVCEVEPLLFVAPETGHVLLDARQVPA